MVEAEDPAARSAENPGRPLVTIAQMPFDDDFDDERPAPDRYLPKDDRLWRHPSELGPPATPTARRPAWMPLVGAALAGAVLAAGAMWFVGPTRGGSDARPTPTTASLRAPATSTAPTKVASFAPNPVPTEELGSEVGPSIALVRVDRDGVWTSATAIWVDDDGTLAASGPAVQGADHLVVEGVGGEAQDARVAGIDEATGVAALVVAETAGQPLADTRRPTKAGEPAAVIGAAEAGAGHRSETASIAGVIVRVVGTRSILGTLVLHDSVQLDRSVPADAQGAAVVDAQGDLLGLVVGNADDERLAAVTPGPAVLQAATELRERGTVRRAWLGVRAVDLDPALATLLGTRGGALLTRVDAASPADRAGLRPDDIVVAVDGSAVIDASDLVVTLRSRRPGQHTTLSVRRGPLEVEVTATLGG